MRQKKTSKKVSLATRWLQGTWVGITERSVQRILSELEEGGFIKRDRVGLRNRYRFKTNIALRHPIEAHCKIGDLINMVESKGR